MFRTLFAFGLPAWLWSAHAADTVPKAQDWQWRPREKTVQVTCAPATGADGKPVNAWHITGPIHGGWNYAVTNPVRLEAGRVYRLSAEVRVDSLGPGTPPPFLKCEFVGRNGSGKELGRAGTRAYDLARIGKWQTLVGEFEAPRGTVSAWLALEKGAQSPMRIDAWVRDTRLVRIPHLSVLDQYRKQLPPALEAWRGKRPRLFLSAAQFVEIKAKLTRPDYAALWAEIRAQADSYLRHGPPKYRKTKDHSGNEQLWQRGVGNAMPVLAMAWQLTGDRRYLDSARAWALASCGYPTWGLGRTNGMDLAAGHQLLGLAVVYDWCGTDLDEEARSRIRETLEERAGAMFVAAATGKVWWPRSYLQNHLWVNACGMAAAGFSLFDETDDARCWIGLPLEKFRRTMKSLGPDGASHEGVGYWEYGAEYMMKFITLARSLLGEDLIANSPWWRHTATYFEYLSLPRNAWSRRSSLVDIADCPRGNWYGPDYLLRGLARWFRDGHAQEFATAVDRANIDAAGARWLNLVWFDPTVKPLPPTDLPTLHHFADMGIVSARSDWSGNGSLVVFKCGPFIGHKAIHEFQRDPGGGHVHPDANHFLVFADGEWLIRDDGYRFKWTHQHNTLLIDGHGQLGEGHAWFSGSEALRERAEPRILHVKSTPRVDVMTGDAAAAYPEALGLERFVRTLVFLKPDILLVIDDITTRREADLELRFHPESNHARRENTAVLIDGKRARLRIELQTPQSVDMSAGALPMFDRLDKQQPFFTVRMLHRGRRWRNVTALSWSPSNHEPPHVVMKEQDGRLGFQASGHPDYAFAWDDDHQ